MKNDDLKNYALVFVAGCLWGTQGMFMKMMTSYGSSSLYTGFLRLLLAFIIMASAVLIKYGASGFRVSRRSFLTCMLLGFITQGIYNACYITSVNINGMATASVLLYVAPVFTALTAMIVFSERLTGRRWLALALNIAGCVLTVTGGRFTGLSVAAAGLLFGLGAALGYSMNPIIGRSASQGDAPPLVVAMYTFMFGCITLMVMMPWRSVSAPLDLRLLGTAALLALIPTAIPYALYYKGLSKIKESSRVPVVASVELIVATVLGIAVFGEPVSAGSVIGIFAVLGSIALFN